MQTEREKKFFEAIETIKNMIGQGLVTQDYARKERVTQIIIGSTYAGPTYAIRDNEDRVTGYDVNSGLFLHIREPEDLLRQELAEAKKDYDAAFGKQVDMSKAAQAAEVRVRAIQQRMVEQGIKP